MTNHMTLSNNKLGSQPIVKTVAQNGETGSMNSATTDQTKWIQLSLAVENSKKTPSSESTLESADWAPRCCLEAREKACHAEPYNTPPKAIQLKLFEISP